MIKAKNYKCNETNFSIALLANKRRRQGPNSQLAKLIREFEPFFREVFKPELYAIEGTYAALLKFGLLHGYTKLHHIRSGNLGGVVEIAALVVGQNAGEEGIDSKEPIIDMVIYLIDPSDPMSIFPANIALKRECVVAKKPFISTYNGAREWLTLKWFCMIKEKNDKSTEFHKRFFLDNNEERRLLPFISHTDILSKQAIALIAHDKKKNDIIEFAYRNFDFLTSFKRRYATGVTGTILNGKIPKEWELTPMGDKENEIKSNLFKRLQDKLRETGFNKKKWIDPIMPGGPEGGDVRIAKKILNGECQKVLFFEDPQIPRQHEADIQLLERTARICDDSLTCLHDELTANTWVKMWQNSTIRHNRRLPMTLIQAYRMAFNGVELVLADTVNTAVNEDDDESRETVWQPILSKAAIYISALIEEIAQKRLAEGNPAKVAVTWGFSLYELIQRIKRLPRDYDNIKKIMELPDSFDDLMKPLKKSSNLMVVPMVGQMRTTNPRVEASTNALELSMLLGGNYSVLHQSSFIDQKYFNEVKDTPQFKTVSDYWDDLDVAIYTCDSLQKRFGVKAMAPLPDNLYNNMETMGAVGEIGGLFLNDQGMEVISQDYERIGITYEKIQETKRKGGSILVAGAQSRRRGAIVLAALKGDLVSTLVTDLEFAHNVLKYYLKNN